MNKHARTVAGRNLRERSNEVLFMDLRTWNQNIETYTYDKGKRKKKTVLTLEQITEVKKVYNSWQEVDGPYVDVPELCKSITLEGEGGLRDKGFALAPSKYIEFIDHDLDIDYENEMSRIQSEMQKILALEKESQAILEAAFEGIGYGIK